MKKTLLNRRDFLKVLGLSTFALGGRYILINEEQPSFVKINQEKPNILILVYDALSAKHVSLYGYPRKTTPNLERFAKRATVFHQHYSAGNFTSPGTASLLTGVYPWSHRALHLVGSVRNAFTDKNIFHLLKNQYHTFSYTHNPYAQVLLHQFRKHIDQLYKISELCFSVSDTLAETVFFNDYLVAHNAEILTIRRGDYPPGSMFLGPVSRHLREQNRLTIKHAHEDNYPFNVPNYMDRKPPSYLYFKLNEATEWIVTQLREQPRPFLGYIHLLPPHAPYNMRREFFGKFDDGWQPITKPEHFFTRGRSQDHLNLDRRYYDEFIANVDAEFGLLLNFMEQSGILESTILIITSDHGEMFERGIYDHGTPTLFEPVIRVPLLISKPGQHQPQDVTTSTSCVDLLPTLLHIARQPIPDWCEGQVLPTFNDQKSEDERSIYSVEAKENPKNAPLSKASIALVKGRYKLIYYTGYWDEYQEKFEFFDLQDDPEELVDLYEPTHRIANQLRDELITKLKKVN